LTLTGSKDYRKDIEEGITKIVSKRGGNVSMMNRSCMVYSLVISFKLKGGKVITMYDLRGPERMSKGGDAKARKECLAINQNLSALYKVVNGLVVEKKS
jgi:hypothetical protein